jgi:uncharacterized protein YuzE
MKFNYDPKANAGYITVAQSIAPGEVAVTIPAETPAGEGYIFLDFDKNGKLLGIEILGAQTILPQSILNEG